jgi:hypothetical protein
MHELVQKWGYSPAQLKQISDHEEALISLYNFEFLGKWPNDCSYGVEKD